MIDLTAITHIMPLVERMDCHDRRNLRRRRGRSSSAGFCAGALETNESMTESFADRDLATLRAMALSAGLPNTDEMSHDQLVDALRQAGLAEPTGEPVDTSLAGSHPETDAGVYHGEGVGRREAVGEAAAQAGDATEGATERDR
jgi:hypothetical protein